MKTTAFLDRDNRVVNLLVGELTQDERARFVELYQYLGAHSALSVDAGVTVWIGGSYDSTSGVFSPPPSPEPEPEPIVEEPINDDAPIE